MKTAILLFAIMILATGSCFAGTITYIDVNLGTWDGSAFTTVGLDWNTNFTSANFAVGATLPEYGEPLLIDGVDPVSLQDGEYYLYLAEAYNESPLAIQITLDYAGGGSNVEVFTSPGNPEIEGPYTLVSGSGFTASLVTAPQSTYELVGQGQNYSTDGTQNWILDVNSSPEPASWVLLATGLACLISVSRRKPA